jgi:hypothetical protein
VWCPLIQRQQNKRDDCGWLWNLACHLKPSQTFTDAHLRASCQAASPPGTETALPTTAWLSRGWCSLHNASPRANYLPSRTPTAPDVTGRPKISSRTTTTRVTACSPRHHPEGEVSTGASKLGPRDRKTASISRPSDGWIVITSTERLLPTHTHLKSLATSHLNNVTLIMFTYLALLISYVYAVFYTIYCILVYDALTLLVHIFIYS